jgi:hypothetical protein
VFACARWGVWTFIDKSRGAFGALFAGTLLSVINYPKAADTAELEVMETASPASK